MELRGTDVADDLVEIHLTAEDKQHFETLCNKEGVALEFAVNAFVCKTLSANQIPFTIGGGPITDPQVLEAMAEVEQMRADPSYGKSYSSFAEMMDDVFGDDWARPSEEDLAEERRRAFMSDEVEDIKSSIVAINIQMDSDLKQEFNEFCEDVGMPMSTAINIFVRKCLRENQFPFDLTVQSPDAQ